MKEQNLYEKQEINIMENKIERITKQELEKIYGVNKITIEAWMKKHALPMITINSHSKYIRREDLINWENSMIKNKIELVNYETK